MPRYDYVCSCGEVVELQRPAVNRDDPAECPVCGELLRRKIALGMAILWGYFGSPAMEGRWDKVANGEW